MSSTGNISLTSVRCTFPRTHDWPRQKSNKNHKTFSICRADFLTPFLQEKGILFYLKEICHAWDRTWRDVSSWTQKTRNLVALPFSPHAAHMISGSTTPNPLLHNFGYISGYMEAIILIPSAPSVWIMCRIYTRDLSIGDTKDVSHSLAHRFAYDRAR